MSDSLLRAVALLCWLLASPCFAQQLAEGTKLCPHPVSVPMSDVHAEPQRSNVERKLFAALREASFELAEPTAVRALQERVRTESGGYIDAATGERDEARFRAYRKALGSALHAEFGCDAQLHASVVQLRAPFAGGVASWDGTSQAVSSDGRRALHIFRGIREQGWVTALSLWLRVLDRDGNEIAFRSAGIETPVQLAVVEDRDFVPEDRWLTDEARLDAAILSALGRQGESLRLHGAP
jgi:hypothetical protein